MTVPTNRGHSVRVRKANMVTIPSFRFKLFNLADGLRTLEASNLGDFKGLGLKSSMFEDFRALKSSNLMMRTTADQAYFFSVLESWAHI